jgi:ABC-type nickel/cobalt efflux system permease component RcnA
VLQYFMWLKTSRVVRVAPKAIRIEYQVQFVPSAFNVSNPQLDPDGDGTVTAQEKEGFLRSAFDYLVVDLTVLYQDGSLIPSQKRFELEPGGGGFAAEFEVMLPPPDAASPVERIVIVDPVFLFPVADDAYAPDTGVSAEPGVTLLDRNGREKAKSRVPSESSTVLHFRRGVQAGAISTVPAQVADGKTDKNRLGSLMASKDLSAWVVMLALVVAVLLGAAHALAPGHGKTIVAAYLVGSRGRVRDAVFLGLVTAFTHTIGVVLLGVLALALSRQVLQESVFAALGVLSGGLVFVLGVTMLVLRLRAAGVHFHGTRLHAHANTPGSSAREDTAYHYHAHGGTPQVAVAGEPNVHHEHAHVHAGAGGGDIVHAHGHVHLGAGHGNAAEAAHTHGDDVPVPSGDAGLSAYGDHFHPPGAAIRHTHDGVGHTHVVPGRSGVKGLLALGISGGIVPCPDAIVILLLAISLGRIGLGLAVIGAFSVGLAVVLVSVGILMVVARPALERVSGGSGSRFAMLYLPVGSAVIVMLLGIGIVLKVLLDAGIVSVKL